MLDVANAFILFLGLCAIWIGAAAVVQKRSVKRRNEADRSTNAAS
jgi:hypothetical protein